MNLKHFNLIEENLYKLPFYKGLIVVAYIGNPNKIANEKTGKTLGSLQVVRKIRDFHECSLAWISIYKSTKGFYINDNRLGRVYLDKFETNG